MAEDFIEFTKDYSITNKRPKGFDETAGTSLPLPTRAQKKFSAELSGNALVAVGTENPVGTLQNKLKIGDVTTYEALMAKHGFSTNAYQDAFTAVKDG